MTAAELGAYYEGKTLPVGQIKFSRYSTIVDPALFVEAQFSMLRANPAHREND
jgi:hypothetical protein